MGPSERLICDTLDELGLKPGAAIVVEGGDGGLAQHVAGLGADQVTTLSRDARDIQAANRRTGITVSEDVRPQGEGSADLVLLPMPKGRAYTRSLLVATWRALKPGGVLLVAGPSNKGVKGVISDAKAVFGNAEVMGYKDHQRVAQSIKNSDAVDGSHKALKRWWGTEGVMPGTSHAFEVTHAGKTLRFETTAGVFSWEHVDPGSELLLDHLEVDRDQVVYDAGCGAGVLGLFAAAKGAKHVLMSDVDLLSVRASRANAELNGLDRRTSVFAHDGLDVARGPVDLVVSNPAFHQGEKVDLTMAEHLARDAAEALSPDGRLLVVANRFLAYHRVMKGFFGQVTRRAETSKYHVLEALEPIKA